MTALPSVSTAIGICVRSSCCVQDVIVNHVEEGAIDNSTLQAAQWTSVQYWFRL